MSNLIKAEWFKMRKNGSFWVLTGLIITLAVLLPLLEGDKAYWVKRVLSGNAFSSIMGANNYIILKMAPTILAGFFISREYEMGTMKNIAASGNKRFRIFFAKLLVFSVGAIILSNLYPIVTLGTISLNVGFSAFPEFHQSVTIFGLLILYASAFASIMAFFAIIFTHSGITIGFLTLFFLGNNALPQLFPFIQNIYRYSVFKLLFDIEKVNTLGGNELMLIVAVPIMTFIAFTILGGVIFRIKEIK